MVSIVIPNTFFITGLGRSGTLFLSKLMKRSNLYRVKHESFREEWLRENLGNFPIERFLINRYVLSRFNRYIGYGEVNSLLRFAIHPLKVGFEAMIQKRGIILRNPTDVIASAMNRGSRNVDDFNYVCRRILTFYSKLLLFKRHPSLKYKYFDFERITREPEYLKNVLLWAGIDDVKIDQKTIEQKVNKNKNIWFPKYEEWSMENRKYYDNCYREIVHSQVLD